jgi:RNA polymerase sigma factor (sigma-70 family)
VSLPPFQAFLEQHQGEVFRFLSAAVGPDAAEDCFQETFLAALRAYPRLTAGANLRGWVLTIARRKAIDHGRRSARVVPVAEIPERAAAAAEAADGAVWGAVRTLPEKQRAAIALRFVNDLSYRQVAALMGVSEVAARQNVHLGLKQLREEYR